MSNIVICLTLHDSRVRYDHGRLRRQRPSRLKCLRLQLYPVHLFKPEEIPEPVDVRMSVFDVLLFHEISLFDAPSGTAIL